MKQAEYSVRAALAILIAGALGGVESAAQVTFERHEITTGAAQHQILLPGSFRAGSWADLAAVDVAANGDRRVTLYSHEGGDWTSVGRWPLGAEALFVDVVEIGGRERLVVAEDERLYWLDPESGTERVVARFANAYQGAGEDIPRVDIARDISGDGREDLVVPDTDGFWIATQMPDGSFADAAKIGPAEPLLDKPMPGEERTYADAGITAATVPWYLGRVHGMDYNHDGRRDLVFWNAGRLEVHLQNANGRFEPLPRTVTVDVPLDADGAYSLLFTDASPVALILGLGPMIERTALHSLRDMNGDGIDDLVTHTLRGRSLLRLRGRYAVHPGAHAPDSTAFAGQASMAIDAPGRAAGLEASGYSTVRFDDFDADGHVDVAFADVNIGLGGMARAMVGKSVSLDIAVFHSANGAYPAKPTIRRKVRPRLYPFGKGVYFPTVLHGDVNGDGYTDLLFGKSRRELHLFVGLPAPDLLARRPQAIAVDLPDDERRTRLADLDRDGRQDILVHYRSRTGPQRATLLLAR